MDENTQPEVSQASFEETQYADQSWEIIGELEETHEFIPMQVEQLEGRVITSDPMFADYGGIPESDSGSRWHLPDELAGEFQREAEKQALVAAGQIQDEATEYEQLRAEELEQIKAQAFEEGKIAGITEAAEQQNQRLQAIEEQMKSIFSDLQVQLNEAVSSHAASAIQLALQISKKLVDGAVEINPEYILPIVNEALSQVGTARVDRVRVSPQDLEFIELVGLRKTLGDEDSAWDFTADESVKAGCIVDTSAGEVDFQLDEAWARIQDEVIRIAR